MAVFPSQSDFSLILSSVAPCSKCQGRKQAFKNVVVSVSSIDAVAYCLRQMASVLKAFTWMMYWCEAVIKLSTAKLMNEF